jgi:hypothetical protein
MSAARFAHVPSSRRTIISHMPAPTNAQQALERERDELPAHLAHYQRELDVTPSNFKER